LSNKLYDRRHLIVGRYYSDVRRTVECWSIIGQLGSSSDG